MNISKKANKIYNSKKKHQPTVVDQIMCKALSGNLVLEDEFVTDAKTGYQVRVFTKDAPCKRADIMEILLGNRVVTLDEIYKIVGKNVLTYMLSKGYIRQQGKTEMYWVTESAAKQYNLPKVMNCAFLA